MTGRPSFPQVAALPLAGLVAAAALGGILLPSTYARETTSWAAQGVGQDWDNLVLVVPWLAITGVLALRRSRRALLLLAGALVYTLYSFLIYALAVHFNSLFLVYCAVLGLSFFSLSAIGLKVVREDASSWYHGPVPVRLAGGLLVGIALSFTALWLGDVVPALLQGAVPASVTEAGLFTNPVQVLDLSIVLPALLVTGISVFRRRPRGYVLAPILLSFGVLMAIAIGGMLLALHRRGQPVALAVPAALGVLAVSCALVLASFLRHLHRSTHPGACSAPLAVEETHGAVAR